MDLNYVKLDETKRKFLTKNCLIHMPYLNSKCLSLYTLISKSKTLCILDTQTRCFHIDFINYISIRV